MENSIIPSKQHCTYTSCYCEENVWKLCEHIENTHPGSLPSCYAVFISNFQKTIPIWKQKACKKPQFPVVWDYHVIFICKTQDKSTYVYDLDTVLPFPCSFETYLSHAIKSDDILKPKYHRMFRVIPAEIYLRKFASNRQHMINQENNTYFAAPPEYPAIKTSESENNIQDFISMKDGYGQVQSMVEFTEFFK